VLTIQTNQTIRSFVIPGRLYFQIIWQHLTVPGFNCCCITSCILHIAVAAGYCFMLTTDIFLIT